MFQRFSSSCYLFSFVLAVCLCLTLTFGMNYQTQDSLLYMMEFSLCMVRFVDATKNTFTCKAAQCKYLLCMCLFCLLKFVPKSLSLKLYIFWNIPLYGISYLTVSWGCFFGSKSVSQEPFFLPAPSEKRRAKPSAYHKAVPPQRKD